MHIEPYFLALDIGTNSVKAVLFDACGREIAGHVEEYAIENTAPDRAEINPEHNARIGRYA